MSPLPIHGQPALSDDDAAFLNQRPEISTPQFLKAVLEDQREEVAKMIVHDDRLVRSRDASGASAILLAAYQGLDDMMALLLRSEVELDLWEAAAVGDVARLEACLDADPALQGQLSGDGYPALVLAAFLGRVAAADALLARGADPGQASVNPMAMTPLHAACAHAGADAAHALVRRLLAAGAPCDAQQAGGYTPLHLAALRGRTELVRLLLAAGADPDAPSDRDETAGELAQARGHHEVADLLTSTVS